MSVTVTYDNYSDLCDAYNIGKEILDLPKKIIDALDKYFAGKTITQWGTYNPDNVYVNYLDRFDNREVVTYQTKLLSEEEFDKLESSGQLESWFEKYYEQIKDRLSSKFVVLGYDSGTWYVLQFGG